MYIIFVFRYDYGTKLGRGVLIKDLKGENHKYLWIKSLLPNRGKYKLYQWINELEGWCNDREDGWWRCRIEEGLDPEWPRTGRRNQKPDGQARRSVERLAEGRNTKIDDTTEKVWPFLLLPCYIVQSHHFVCLFFNLFGLGSKGKRHQDKGSRVRT